MRTCRVTVPDLKNGWTDCAQIWYTVRDRLVGGRAQVNWRYPGAISHVQGSLSRSLRWSPQKALYWLLSLHDLVVDLLGTCQKYHQCWSPSDDDTKWPKNDSASVLYDKPETKQTNGPTTADIRPCSPPNPNEPGTDLDTARPRYPPPQPSPVGVRSRHDKSIRAAPARPPSQLALHLSTGEHGKGCPIYRGPAAPVRSI